MKEMKFFSDQRLKFARVGPEISESQILHAIKPDFPGKDAFVRFYLAHNGGYFSGAPFFPRWKFYPTNSDEFSNLEVDGIYYIPPDGVETRCGVGSMLFSRERDYEEMDEFNRKYIPISGFEGKIEIWIEILSGVLMYIEWESLNPFETIKPAAPSFLDFVSNIEYRSLSDI